MQNLNKRDSLFLQLHMKNTLLVKLTALPITTTPRASCSFVDIIFYYLEKSRSCYKNWIHFVSPANTWTVCRPCTSTASTGKVLQGVEMCLTMCREQPLSIKETEVGQNAECSKKRLVRKKFKQLSMSALQKNKSTKLSGSVFAERIEKTKKTNI